MVELPGDAIEALIDEAQAKFWTRYIGVLGPLRQTVKFVAARVRAEAVAEHRADLEHRIEVSTRIENDRRVAEAERDEYRRNWQEAERRTAKAVAEAVAGERQRIEQLLAPGDLDEDSPRSDLIRTVAYQMNAGSYDGRAPRVLDAVLREVLDLLAAGSVPVATPDGHVHDSDTAYDGVCADCQDSCGCCGQESDGPWCGACRGHVLTDRPPWDCTYHAQHGRPCPRQAGPVATPTEDRQQMTEYVLLTERCTQRECGDRIRYSELTDNQNTHWHVKPGVSLVAVASVATPTGPEHRPAGDPMTFSTFCVLDGAPWTDEGCSRVVPSGQEAEHG